MGIKAKFERHVSNSFPGKVNGSSGLIGCLWMNE